MTEFAVLCDMRKSHVALTQISLSDFKIIWHNRPRFNAVFNCFYLFSKFKTLGGDMRTNNKRE